MVRGPLRPDKAAELGFAQNQSPLSLLFQAFRRSTPKPKVAGCYARILIVPGNDQAEEMARRFYAGESEYQTDAKWWELVQEADRELLQAGQPSGTGGGGLPGLVQPPVTAPPTPTGQPAPTIPPPARTAIQALSREYRDDVTGQRWDVRAFGVSPNDPVLGDSTRPWVLRATAAGIHEFFVNLDHEIFASATMTSLDGLLAELSWAAMDFARGGAPNASFAGVLAALRERYAGASKLDPVALSAEATMSLSDITRSLSRTLSPEDSASLFQELSLAEREAVLQKMAARAVRDPQRVLSEGRFLEFAPRKTLLNFFQRHPELFLDGKYWDEPYSILDFGSASATEEARARIARHYLTLLTDAVWLADNDPTELADASRSRLLRASLALELLAPTSPTARAT